MIADHIQKHHNDHNMKPKFKISLSVKPNPNYSGPFTPGHPFAPCKVCGHHVNLDNEGTQYGDGTQAHDQCADNESYRNANSPDWD